ncbi:MAG: hypothetical protein V3U54_13225 [Thermodesulfobacteriota bacterium]
MNTQNRLPTKPRNSKFLVFDEPVKIELVYTDDPYTNLSPGDQGYASAWSLEAGKWKLDVKWDIGTGLSLLDGIDKWKTV